MHAVPSALI
jgi:hypothetical protein